MKFFHHIHTTNRFDEFLEYLKSFELFLQNRKNLNNIFF